MRRGGEGRSSRSEFGASFRAVLIEGGLSRNRRIYMPEVLEAAVPRFDGVPVHVEHSADLSSRDECEVVGYVRNVRFEVFVDRHERRWPQVIGTLAFEDEHVRRALLEWRARRARPMGVSVVLSVDSRPLTFGPGDVWQYVTNIMRVHAADLTGSPAARGRVLGIVTGAPRAT